MRFLDQRSAVDIKAGHGNSPADALPKHSRDVTSGNLVAGNNLPQTSFMFLYWHSGRLDFYDYALAKTNKNFNIFFSLALWHLCLSFFFFLLLL